MDGAAVDLRLAHEPALHPETQSALVRRPEGLRRLLRGGKRHEREETERFKSYSYDELVGRDKTNLDIFWLRDESLEDTDNLPDPDVLAAEIVENLGAALEQFSAIQEELETVADK
jgi:type I restriction enzyme M protein